MEIILATTSDVKSLLIFSKVTFIATYAHLNEPVFFEQYLEQKFSPDAFEKEFSDKDSEFWLIKENDEIVAYIKLNINRLHDAQIETISTSGSMSELERIYIAENQKGKGLGKLLIQQAIERCIFHQNDWLWLGVWSENYNAIAFYKKMGFEIFGEHLFHMGDDPQNDYLLRIKPA